MFTLPNPLHPAIVHFPIVLLVLAAVAALAAVPFRRVSLQALTATLLLLGSVGSFVAAETGEDDEDKAEKAGATAKAVFETHEEWAERTEGAAAVAAGLGIASVGSGVWALRRQRAESLSIPTGQPASGWRASDALGLGLRAATAAAALAASYCVYETGHAGGKLVYEYGVGVKTGGTAGVSQAVPAHQDAD